MRGPDPSQGLFWKSWYNWFIVLLLVGTFGLWAFVHMQGTTDAQTNYVYSLLLGVIPFFASFKGFVAARKWGGMGSLLGKSIGGFSLGLMLWSVGELIWSYYNLVLKVEAPYPSVADIGFTAGVTFWIIGTVFLYQVAGAGLVLRRRPKLLWLVAVLQVIGLGVSYFLLVGVARQGQLLTDPSDKIKVIVDIYYPLADLISLALVTTVVVLSGRYLGGKLRLPIVLTVLGLAVMYVGDVIFGYTTSVGSFYNADWGDLVLLVGVGLLSFALLCYAEIVPRLGLTTKAPEAE